MRTFASDRDRLCPSGFLWIGGHCLWVPDISGSVRSAVRRDPGHMGGGDSPPRKPSGPFVSRKMRDNLPLPVLANSNGADPTLGPTAVRGKSMARSFRFALGLVSLFWIAGVASARTDYEQRCADLGSACLCSEPLDSTPASALQVGSEHLNPSDSVTKQCGGADAAAVGAAYAVSNSGGAADPKTKGGLTAVSAGIGTVGVAWHTDNPLTLSSFISGVVPPTNLKRMCVRHYERYASDFGTWAGPNWCNNKTSIISYHATSGSGQQVAQSRGGSLLYASAGGFTQNAGTNFGQNLSDTECRGQWCRFELCIGGDNLSGGATQPSNLTMELYMTVITGPRAGLQQKTGPISLGSPTGSVSGWDRIQIAEIYREATGTCGGGRDYSHAMQAGWTTNAGQTIGPASEVEGGGGGGGSTSLGPPGKPALNP